MSCFLDPCANSAFPEFFLRKRSLMVLWAHGTPRESLCDLALATVISRLPLIRRSWMQSWGVVDVLDTCTPSVLMRYSSLLTINWFDLPPSSYDVRPCTHQKLLLDKTSYINNDEFVIHMLYTDSYWLLYMSMNYVLIFYILCYLLFLLVKVAFASFFFEE